MFILRAKPEGAPPQRWRAIKSYARREDADREATRRFVQYAGWMYQVVPMASLSPEQLR